MTDLLSRTHPASPPSAADPAAPPPPMWLAATAAGLAAASAGVLACLGIATLTWLSGEAGSMTEALRAGAGGWLLAHGSSVDVDGGTVGVVPLGLTLAAAAAAWVAGRWCAGVTAAASGRDVAVIAGAVGVAYAAVVAGVGLMTAGPVPPASAVRAAVVGLLLASAAAALGSARACSASRRLLDRLTPQFAPVMRGAGAGVAALLGCGALLLAASLVAHVETSQRLLSSLHLGVGSGLLLVVLCVAFLPNVVLFPVTVLLGPGFVLGTGTTVSATSVTLGAVPAVPWFAALPAAGDQPLWVSALMVVPVLCGAVGGAVAVRAVPASDLREASTRGGLSGCLAGFALALLLAVSGGSIGPGRMANVGPQLVTCLVVAALALGAGGALGGAGARVAAARD